MSTEEKNVLVKTYSILNHKSPFPGLRPFLEDEPELFFGRDKQIAEIIERLGKNNVTAILGGSGCGKSSLVRAGVISELRTYGIPNCSDTWIVVTVTPGEEPIERLAVALNQHLIPCNKDIETEFERTKKIKQILQAPLALSNFFKKYKNDFDIKDSSGLNLGERANLLVLVDQFEEIFRPQNTAQLQTEQLINLIAQCYEDPHKQVYLMLTMRSEFLEHCANYPEFADVLNKVSYLTRRLKIGELEAVIIQPAQRFAAKLVNQTEKPLSTIEKSDIWPFEESVLKQLMSDVYALHNDTDHLPLLQHFLFWLWKAAFDRWDKSGRSIKFSITEADLKIAAGTASENTRNLGSLLRNALNNHAQTIYNQLNSPLKQKIAENMFRLLAKVDDKGIYTRRWTNIDEILKLSEGKDNITREALEEEILTPFIKPHTYLRHDKSNGQEQTIDVAHEALIRNWEQFKKWLKQEKEARDIYLSLLKQSHVEINPIKEKISPGNRFWLTKLFSSNKDLLSEKEVGAIEQINIDRLGSSWAKRYHDDQSLLVAGIPSIKPDSNSEDKLFQQAIDYFQLSRKIFRVKRNAKHIFVFVLPICFIGFWSVMNESHFNNLAINTLQPYIVANALRENASDQPERFRPARLHQLSVVLRSMENLYNRKESFWFERLSLFNTNLMKQEKLWRLARSATDSSVRLNLGALVSSKIGTHDNKYEDPLEAETEPDEKCINEVMQPLINPSHSKNQSEEIRGIKMWTAKVEPAKNWRPIIIKTDSQLILGVKIGPEDMNTCKFVRITPLSAKGSFTYNDSLQFLMHETITQNGPPILNFYRIHWFSNPLKGGYDGIYKAYQADLNNLGQIDDAVPESIKLLSGGKGFSIKVKPKDKGSSTDVEDERRRYEIQWTDTLDPVKEKDLDKIESKYFQVETKSNTLFTLEENKLAFNSKSVDVIQKEDRAIFTSYAYKEINKNSGYLAYITANLATKDRQLLTILKFDKKLFKEKPESVQLEIAQFQFHRPPIKKITFGIDDHDGWIFFKTEAGGIYRTVFGLQQMREQLCEKLKGIDPKDYTNQATSAFKVFKQRDTGIISKTSQEKVCS